MTITISHNEVIVACRKAFEALGLPLGQAEDAADAIGWLALHGLPFQDQLATALNSWQAKPAFANPLSQSLNQSEWDAQGGSALHVFPNLVDYGSVQAQKNGTYTLSILNMPDVGLLWGYVVCVQQRGVSLVMQWADGAAGLRQVICKNGDDRPTINGFQEVGAWRTEKVEIVFFPEGESELDGSKIRIATPESLNTAGIDHTADGIQVEEALWNKLATLGKGLLVESTEESESRGAGGV